MNHYLGLAERKLVTQNTETPIPYNPLTLLNAHLLLCGMSGTGKSHQSVRFLNSAARSGIEIDIFDVHEELDGVIGSTACKYSQATGFGYNPLVLDTDPHVGGVNRQVDFFVRLIKEVTAQLGSRQEAVLRNLITDTYAAAWIKQSDPKSWHRRQITEKEYESIIEQRRYSDLRQFYPTMDDLKSYAKRKIIALTIGGDNKCVSAFEQLTRLRGRLDGLRKKWAKAADDEEVKKIEGQISGVQNDCIEAYSKFVASMENGREIDDILKYDSVEVLSSVMRLIDLLNSAGIFRANQPPFGDAKVRVHQIKSLTTEQQVLFTKLRLREIFEKWKKAGPTQSGTEVRHVIFLDEAHKYFSSDPDDIINVLAKEARKFGIGLWCASQEPTAFPESFLTNVGATVLLGLHPSYWKRTMSMLRITEDDLKSIRPKEVLAIKLMREGFADPPFINVIVPNPKTEHGQRAADFFHRATNKAA